MQISLACYHFTCTTVVLWIASRRSFNLFVPVRLPFMQMIPLCSFFAGGIILGNLSLTFNSVGFYQSVHRRQEWPLANILKACQNNDYPLCGSPPVSLLGKICHPSHRWCSRQCVHRCRPHKYWSHGDDKPRCVHCNRCLRCNSILPSVDRQENEGFLGVEPPIAVKPGPDICVIIGVFGAILRYSAGRTNYSKWHTCCIIFVRSCSCFIGISSFHSIFLMHLIWQPLESVTILDHRTNECFDIQRCLKVSVPSSTLDRRLERDYNLTSNSVKTIIILSYGWISEGRTLTVRDSLGIMLALGGASVYSQLSQKWVYASRGV